METPVEKPKSTPKISLEAWAVLWAHLGHFPKDRREEVVERLGMDPKELAATEAEGQRLLFVAMDTGDVDALESFGMKLHETRQKLKKENKKLEDLGPRRKAKTDEMPERPLQVQAPPNTGIVAPSAALPSASRKHPCLTLHQYASLRAETANAGDEKGVATVRERYGLDATSDAAEATAWGVRFRDRNVFDEYQRLFQYFRAMAPRA
jgi:hypothetical protein